MNAKRLAGHLAAAVPFNIVWGVGATLAPGAAPWYIWLVGTMPEVIALALVAVHERNDRLEQAHRAKVAAKRAARRVEVPEITRPPARRELTSGRR